MGEESSLSTCFVPYNNYNTHSIITTPPPPNRQYLRGREDTVRYIVTSLTDEFCSELSEELLVATPLVLDDSHSDEDSMEHWDTWTPDPVHAHTCKGWRGGEIMFIFIIYLLSYYYFFPFSSLLYCKRNNNYSCISTLLFFYLLHI